MTTQDDRVRPYHGSGVEMRFMRVNRFRHRDVPGDTLNMIWVDEVAPSPLDATKNEAGVYVVTFPEDEDA